MNVGELVVSARDGEIGIITELVPHPTTGAMSYLVWWSNPAPVPWSLERANGNDVRCADERR